MSRVAVEEKERLECATGEFGELVERLLNVLQVIMYSDHLELLRFERAALKTQ